MDAQRTLAAEIVAQIESIAGHSEDSNASAVGQARLAAGAMVGMAEELTQHISVYRIRDDAPTTRSAAGGNVDLF